MNEGTMVSYGRAYASLTPWAQYLAPRRLDPLHKRGLIVKLANQTFATSIGGKAMQFKAGTLIVTIGNNQTIDPA